MSTILAIDPGTTEGAAVMLTNGRVTPFGVLPNDRLLQLVKEAACDCIVCEWIECMGMAVGKETFETVFFIGRIAEAAPVPFHRVTRREVKLNLCGSMKAKDPNIRQALLDRFGGSAAVGRKASKGPLYGISSHQWSALAVGITFLDKLANQRN